MDTSRESDLSYLLSDLERVAVKLIQAAETDRNERRRVNAVKALQALFADSGSYELRKRLLARMICLGTRGTTTSELEAAYPLKAS